ncbi:MAG: YbaB/EbfC family nucleoid-associated protein [candidate division NC10 bacterium]|nr:YbaB/EbfC family nucleoid-associated protein [candidate division NC10 bacterium]
MKGLGDLMKQAERLRVEMARIQEEVAGKKVEASAGGGMVTVACNGRGEIISVKIDPEVVQAGELDMLQDLIVAATNEALRKSRDLLAQEMSRLTGGLNLAGLI